MFFEIYLNVKKEILVFRMKILTRILSIIFLISMILLVLFNLTFEEFKEYYLYQKILFGIIFFLSFLGTFYVDSIKFYKKVRVIEIKKGILIFYKKFTYSFDDLEGILVKKLLKKPNYLFLDFSEKNIYVFGLRIKGKDIIIENRLDEAKFNEFIKLFKSFFPNNLELINF